MAAETGTTQANSLTESHSKDAWYQLAKRLDIPGRSTMTKDELLTAVNHSANGPAGRADRATRFDEFARLAKERVDGRVVELPRNLPAEDRRLHVRQTLREDHQTRISDYSLAAQEKFDKLAGSLFSFFRGTCLLFYRDMAGDDAWMPTVLALGDVHPENFGVMPSADNIPVFGVNDFDEAHHAPFTWDLKRGATGFLLAAHEKSGLKPKKRLKVARHFVKGYIAGMRDFAQDDRELEHQLRYDNAPKMIAQLIESARASRSDWLAEDYHEEYGRGFRNDEELVPASSRIDEFQDLVNRWIDECNIDVPPRAGSMRVKDVAVRRGQGTASLGLSRYYVLIEGERADATDDIIIEFKRARRSALAGLVPSPDFGSKTDGERIAYAQRSQLVRGDGFYGSVEFEGHSFMSRERAPFRDDIDLDDLSSKGWRKYARICGRSLAQAHALSDETQHLDFGTGNQLGADVDIDKVILQAMEPNELFIDDILRFAVDAARRVTADHEHFKADHELRAFTTIDVAYR